MAATFKSVGFELDKSRFGVMAQLSSWLSTLQSSELVLLIDEYDAPLTHCLDKPELFEEVRATMSELFLTLKSHEGRLRFFFIKIREETRGSSRGRNRGSKNDNM
mgnify:FL=1